MRNKYLIQEELNNVILQMHKITLDPSFGEITSEGFPTKEAKELQRRLKALLKERMKLLKEVGL